MKVEPRLTGYKAVSGRASVWLDRACQCCSQKLPDDVVQVDIDPSTRERARACDLLHKSWEGWRCVGHGFRSQTFTFRYGGGLSMGTAVRMLMEFLSDDEPIRGIDYVRHDWWPEVVERAEVPTKPAGLRRVALGKLSKAAHPHLSQCMRCGMTWADTQSHTTDYGGGGCFPLCETCWAPLSPEERLPFYARLILEWQDDTKWPAIKAAVLEGR